MYTISIMYSVESNTDFQISTDFDAMRSPEHFPTIFGKILCVCVCERVREQNLLLSIASKRSYSQGWNKNTRQVEHKLEHLKPEIR